MTVDLPGTPSPWETSTSLRLIAAGRLAQRRLEEELALLGLSWRLFGALGHLARQPDLSISDLARRAGVTAQSMHATVHALEDMGAVQPMVPGPGVRARLAVTDQGRQLLASARSAVGTVDERLTVDLDRADVAALAELLDRFLPWPAPTGR